MDIESDDSERWEDFFGSSTELAPSLLGLYDTLTSTLDGSLNSTGSGRSSSNGSGSGNDSYNGSKKNIHTNSESCSQICSQNEGKDCSSYSPQHNHDGHEHSQLKPSLQQQFLRLESDGSSNCSDSSSYSPLLSCSSLSPSSNQKVGKHRDSPAALNGPNSTNSANKHRNNIRVLSPNVQRIITHSDAEPVHTIDIGALQNHLQSPVLSPVLQHRFIKKTASPTNSHKVKFSHIPLSKITGKLTQSGNELVETFDSSSEYLDALSNPQTEKKSRAAKKPPTPAIIQIPTADDEKTPTNNGSPFNFDCMSIKTRLSVPKTVSQESISLIEMEKLSTTSQLISASTAASTPKAKEFVATEPLSLSEGVEEAINFTLVSENLEKLALNNEGSQNSSLAGLEVIAAINNTLISKPLVRSSSTASASTVASSPLLTYARSKSLAAKANTLGGPVPIKLPTAQQLEELEEASKMSAESLDRLTDIKSKFSPKESRKLSVLMLPEIAKLKHRPLSSSSICSTSSSSSSGSDQLNGKLATSYLASVESLADQSENELMDPHSGMSVFERACMEIVDSERSFVEDLGQVIRGYLLDWKERACLRYDELRILFANIEEIYDFNSTLLKQLINSGMDPVKIAKCFIELRERFDVYTTYCTSYPEAISLLTKLLQATHTNALLTSTQKMLQHTLPLGSYLLKPVQRILKYHLLLDNLRKHCDVKEVFQAYEIMRQVARNIDQVKRKLEQQSRVKELSGILDGWLGPELTVLGELRQEGLLMEHNKPRMVFLFATMLIITKSKEDNRLQFKSYIHQNNLMLSEHLPGEPTSFYVIPYDEPRNQIKLTAKNRDQKRLWAQHIKGVILEKFDNIPNRAKELVYKLGDEEDRTPDKNTWKWSLHSTSTPVYLERRNQYRRSEMRNRSKFKRKTVTNSSSFDSFNEITEVTKEAPKTTIAIESKNSMDDNMLPSLQQLMAAKSDRSKLEKSGAVEANTAENCSCILRNQHNQESAIFNGKMLKERSKSVPRISPQTEDTEERKSLHGSNTNLDARKSKSTKSVDVKQYNYKTMPKRIATLKKQRSNKKETSKFYMDLSEFEETSQTVLKITESKENLLESKDMEKRDACQADRRSTKLPDVVDVDNSGDLATLMETKEIVSPPEKAKKDAQIILDLLKHNKEFERLCKKPQKKRPLEGGAITPTSPEDEPPPRPPSRSPPPLESEVDLSKSTNTADNENEEEHVYESLLRNVHVPYKFSPMLGRSKSVQYYTPRENKPIATARPESDYVTLVYSPEGALQKVGDDVVDRIRLDAKHDNETEQQRDSSGSASSSSSTLKRESQNTVINVDCSSFGDISELSTSTTEAIYVRPVPKNLMKRLLSSNGSKALFENVSTSENSLLPRGRKSIDNISLPFGRSNKPPERRVSDVSEMCRQSILHRQGSEAVGERMAHVDYADPKTLFSMSNSEASLSLQRDSVFSLTSSNDSVCDHKCIVAGSSELATNFEYEDDVEACLETDFRDSAIYSDDNDKRVDYETSDYIKRPTSPPPPPPSLHGKGQRPPHLLPKPDCVPSFTTSGGKTALRQTILGGRVIICPPHMSQSVSRSWVLQQIENFNK